MVDKEIFGDHMIAKTIKLDLQKVKTSPEMTAFQNGLKYKGEFTKEKDLQLVNLLLSKLEQYAQGWISANAMRTGELYRKSQILDEQIEIASKTVLEFCGVLDHFTNERR